MGWLSLVVALAWLQMWATQNQLLPLHLTPSALCEPREPALVLTLDVLWAYLAKAGCLPFGTWGPCLFTWGDASQGRHVALPQCF